jgi:hypothetical protein
VRGGVLLTALVLAVGAWGVWRGAHHAVYEGVLVPLVAHRVPGDARTPEEVTHRVQEFSAPRSRDDGLTRHGAGSQLVRAATGAIALVRDGGEFAGHRDSQVEPRPLDPGEG